MKYSITIILTTICIITTQLKLLLSLTNDEIQTAYDLWQSQNATNYEFVFNWDCFCQQCWVADKLVEVTNSSISSVSFNNADDADTCEDNFLYDYQYDTIEELFERLFDKIDTAYAITAQFDSVLGYPYIGFINPEMNIADDELSWTIDCLTMESLDNITNGCNNDVTELTQTCDDGRREATLFFENLDTIVCNDLIVGRRVIGGTVCVTRDTSSNSDLLVTFETYSSENDWYLDEIYLWFDDESDTYPQNGRGSPLFDEFEYQSGDITSETTSYQFSIPLSNFEVFDNICDWCDTRVQPWLYFGARIELGGSSGSRARVFATIGTQTTCL